MAKTTLIIGSALSPKSLEQNKSCLKKIQNHLGKQW
jgi:hypothetical protein